MEAEASPLIARLGLTSDDTIFRNKVVPFLAFSGIFASIPVTVITNGKDAIYGTAVDNCGTVPAALATHVALDQILFAQKDNGQSTDASTSSSSASAVSSSSSLWLLNAGTCGGFQRKTAQIGDVFLTTAVAHHDRRIPIPQFEEYGIGKLSFHDNDSNNNSTNSNKHHHYHDLDQWAQDLGYKLGVCSTGNSLDATERDHAMMEHVNDASVKDMEAAAVAWVCAMHHVPFVGIKVVTDIVDGDRPTQEEFLEHLHTAAASLQEAVPKVLDYLIAKHAMTNTTTTEAKTEEEKTAAEEATTSS